MSHTVHKPDYPTYITVFTQYKNQNKSHTSYLKKVILLRNARYLKCVTPNTAPNLSVFAIMLLKRLPDGSKMKRQLTG